MSHPTGPRRPAPTVVVVAHAAALAAASAALVAPAAVHAQLRGTVVAAAGGQPVAGAYVVVRRSGPDTSVAATARSDAEGRFVVRGLRPGRYAVRVRALSFAPLARAGVEVPAGGAPVDLGRLALAAVATQLGGVRVVEEREATALAPDRNSFDTRELPAAAGGTAVDVLRNVPAVEVDGDNNVSLRGNANVVVQINGRPSPLRGQQLGQYLAQLPANLVAKVEVSTNPSARNDPDGASGVINIVLAQRTDLGTSGGVQAATATTGLANLTGNLGRQQGPWTGFASYGFFREQRPQVGTTDRFDASGLGPDALLATFDGFGRPAFHNGTLRGERRFGRHDALSADVTLNGGEFRRTNDARFLALDGGVDVGRFAQRSAMRSRNVNQDYVLAWRRQVDPATNVRSVELRFNDAASHFVNTLRQDGAGPAGGGTLVGLSRDVAVQRTPTWRLQTDWTRGLGRDTKLEAGAVGIVRRSRSTAERANAANDAAPWVTDEVRTNGFTYGEQVAAAYGVVSRRAGRLELQGGLRLERATTDLRLAEPVRAEDVGPGGAVGQRFRNAYASAFPNALAAFNLDARRQVKASYSRRISRPDPGQLSPVPYREDQFNLFQGNPGLRPEYTDAWELGYQHQTKWGSVQVAPYWRRTPDAVRYVRAVDTAGVTRATFANVALAQSYGTDVNATVRVAGGRFTLFGGGSVFGARTDARNVTPDVSFRTVGWNARANATLKLDRLTDLSTFAMYRAPQATEAGRQRYFAMTTFALRRKLRGDAATLTLRATDPFNTMAWGVRTITGPLVQENERYFGARALGLAFNYAFGQAPRLRPPRPDEGGQPAGGGAPGGGPPG